MSKPESGATQTGQEEIVPGASWATQEIQIIPKNNLPIVCTGLALSLFLAAIDQVCWHASLLEFLIQILCTIKTIVSTALPTIIGELGGGNNYSWVGRLVGFSFFMSAIIDTCLSVYLLAAASLSPLEGKLSDLIGMLPQLCSQSLSTNFPFVGRKPIIYSSLLVFLVG
jgi:MFS family permease